MKDDTDLEARIPPYKVLVHSRITLGMPWAQEHYWDTLDDALAFAKVALEAGETVTLWPLAAGRP